MRTPRSKKRVPRSLLGYTHHNKVKLVHGGSDYFDVATEMIGKAKSIVHLQTYIFEEDETGKRMAAALKAAAQRKVKVFLLLDGYASQGLSGDFIKEIKAAGVRFRWFWPLFKSRSFYLGRRMHHKILVTDGAYGLAGGVNVSNRYNDMPTEKAWLDRALFVEGEAALKLHIICNDVWRKAFWTKGISEDATEWVPGIKPPEECLVRVRRNDWVMAKNQISRSYVEMFRNASSHITIMSSYFLPGKILRKQMSLAAKRGVTIKVIMGGVSDVKVARLAEQYMYRWLFRNKIEIYEYQETVLHAKLAAYDGAWVTVGSYNVNRISAYASVELNMDVKNAAFAATVEQELNTIMDQQCVRITPEVFSAHTSLLKKVLQRLSYQSIRLLFFLFTFYFRQEKGTK